MSEEDIEVDPRHLYLSGLVLYTPEVHVRTALMALTDYLFTAEDPDAEFAIALMGDYLVSLHTHLKYDSIYPEDDVEPLDARLIDNWAILNDIPLDNDKEE